VSYVLAFALTDDRLLLKRPIICRSVSCLPFCKQRVKTQRKQNTSAVGVINREAEHAVGEHLEIRNAVRTVLRRGIPVASAFFE